MNNTQPASLILLGYGAMARGLHAALRERPTAARVAAVVVPASALHDTQAELSAMGAADIRVATELPAVLAPHTSMVVECAGHAALQIHAPHALQSGVDVLVASVGALANPTIEAELRRAASAGGARVLIPSGALGGLDALAAAALAGLDEVTCSSTKAPAAWRGTAAESMVDLAALTQATTFFRGTAREAALSFPQNANVAAALALAGVGFERTHIELRADPAAQGNTHRVRAKGAFGHLDSTVQALTLAANPKTSMLAPMSLLQAILKRSCVVGMS
ncbi:aspartate dehydrogenase [Variovorax sp. HJSM1_2]|uniref:aspartate dehydrogenase n=1 Tax=Variovorax sp. HJSM1_2 TaxID=3366263 RepID=UPI003BE16E49